MSPWRRIEFARLFSQPKGKARMPHQRVTTDFPTDPRHIRFDDQDKRALAALDADFAISADGEVAAVSGQMEVEIVRLAGDGGDRFRLRIRFPGEELDIKIGRAQLLEQLNVRDDEGA
jgi:hypothetical protein